MHQMALSRGSAQPFRGTLFVWFPDDCRVEVFVRLGVAFFFLGIIIVVALYMLARSGLTIFGGLSQL